MKRSQKHKNYLCYFYCDYTEQNTYKMLAHGTLLQVSDCSLSPVQPDKVWQSLNLFFTPPLPHEALHGDQLDHSAQEPESGRHNSNPAS